MKRTILIIDDEECIRRSFFDWFEDREWTSFESESAERSLEILETESPDCTIVDIRMGGMNGNDFIREAIRKRPNMVFVICTGSPEYSIPDDLLALPCVSEKVFRKPVTSFVELEETMLSLIVKQETK